MPKSSAIIGKVAVKVIPDTSDFKEKLKKDLEKIEKQTKDIKVGVELDADDIKADAKAIRKKAEKELSKIKLKVDLDNQDSLRRSIQKVKAELDKLNEDFELEVDLNKDELQAALDSLNEQLDKVATVDIKVDEGSEASIKRAISKIDHELETIRSQEIKVHLDEKSLNAEKERLRKILDDAAKALDIQAELELSLDRKKAQALVDKVKRQLNDIVFAPGVDKEKLRKTKNQIEEALFKAEDLKAKIALELDPVKKRHLERELDDVQDKIDDLKGKIKLEVGNASATKVEMAMEFLARTREVVFRPILDNKAAAAVAAALGRISGARLGLDWLKDLSRYLANLDKHIPKITAVGLGIFAIAGFALSASSNLFAMSQGLAQMAGIGLALPAIFAAAAIGIGTLIAVFKDFNTRIPEAKKLLAELQDQMSDKFWARAEGPIRNLIDKLFPQFSAGLQNVADRMGHLFGNLADSITRALGPRIGGMFANLQKSIEIVAGSTDAFANIIGVLGSVGSKYLPRLATWIAKIGEKFSTWLTNAEKSGRLEEIIDTAINAFVQFGNIIVAVGRIFNGFFKAAEDAGGSSLTMIADALTNIADIVNGEPFQTEMTEVFRAAHEMFDNIGRASGPAVVDFFKNLGDLLEVVLPLVGTVIGDLVKGLADVFNTPGFRGGLVSLFEGIRVAVEALKPVWEPLGEAIGAVAEVIGVFLETLGPVFADTLKTIAEVVRDTAPAFEPLIRQLGELLSRALEIVMPYLDDLIFIFLDLLEAIMPVLPPLLDLLETILPGLIKVLEALTPVMEVVAIALQGWIMFLDMAIQGWVMLAEEAGKASRSMIENFNNGMTEILVDLGFMTDEQKAAWDKQWSNAIQATSAIEGTLGKSYEEQLRLARESGNLIVADTEDTWGKLKSAHENGWNATLKNQADKFGIMVANFEGLDGALNNKSDAMIAKLKAKFSQGFSDLNVEQSTKYRDMEREWGETLDNMEGSPKERLDSIREDFNLAFQAMDKEMDARLTGMTTTLTMGMYHLGQIVIGFKNLLPQIMRQAGDGMYAAGVAIMESLTNGIYSRFQKIQNLLTTLTGLIPTWKGPADKDATLLFDAGQLIIDGLVNGLESRYGAVRKSLSGLTNDIAGTDLGSLSVPGGVGSVGLNSAANGAYASSGQVQKILNYYAAPGSSISAEEDLFAAGTRSRMEW